ncbi:PREDICTED: ribosomal RNA processing protein 1 homolog B [Chinchilla lanigera]|uniref:Ribosomal RNA processing 1B n=1 Tax=Chinchilla lanigera TaxID=34839 RepID=A0A8C2V5G0_CHILA|nr:PREDICTED: ribosomal RNA processing protein 1 homolog B [Chinchilla lanigera]
MAPVMQPAEIQFAQRLASSEKGVRDRAVRKLRQYLSVKTQRETGGFSQEELLKIWKGLFYCMWVQDEPLLQEELANTISQLIHVVNNSEAQHLFIQTFWQTINREWKEIDKLRLDKYYMLIRLVLRQSFEVLKQNGWQESRIQLFLDVLMKELLCPESQSPDDVRFHFIDIYLDELSRVGGQELLADQNLKFIDPFCRIAAKTKDHTLMQTIARGVFEVIADQSSLALEETVEEQKTNGVDDDLSGEEIPGNETLCKKAVGKRSVPGKCHSRRDGIRGDREGHDCGTLADMGLLLQFDYKAVADRLLEVTSRKNIPPFNRKRLCKLIRKFQDLSEASCSGVEDSEGETHPQSSRRARLLDTGGADSVALALESGASALGFPEEVSADENDHALSQRRKKKKRKKPSRPAELEMEGGDRAGLAEDKDSEGSLQKRKRRKRKKSHVQPETCSPSDTATSPEQIRNGEAGAVEAAPSCGDKGGLELACTAAGHNKRKRQRKRSLRAQGETWEPAVLAPKDSGLPPAAAAQASPADGAQAPKRKRKLGALRVNGSGLSTLACPQAQKEGNDGQATLPQCRRPPHKKAEPGSHDLCPLSRQKTAVSKKRKKMKEVLNLVENNGVLRSTVRQFQATGSSRTLTPLKKPLRTENDFVKFNTPVLPKPLFFRKSKSTSAARPPGAAAQLNKTPPSSKKVTFGLNRNMTAEFKKTDKSLLVSPTGPSRVAFNPEQRPLHGVLKTPASSPTSTALGTRTPLAATPRRRPSAMDFF